jgi:acyl-CoA reductase-like NAD-dependent aldehyde dehydrogenase
VSRLSSAEQPSELTAKDGADGAVLAVRSPVDGREVGRVPVDDGAAVAAAAQRLRGAQPEWERLGPEGRAYWVEALRDWMLDHERLLKDLLQAESGKARGDAVDTVAVIAACTYYAQHAERFLRPAKPRPRSPLVLGKSVSVNWRPYPLVGVIAPWNFPLGLSFLDAVPALMAGCAVLVKPSELTPLSATEVGRAWSEELGAPGVLEVVNGAGPTGEALVDAVDYVQFTGSGRSGQAVMRRAAESLTPVSLELGGKDPMLVIADANLERASRGAVWGSMFNSGQTCISIERAYVERPVCDEFVDRVVRQVNELRHRADDHRHLADVGAMASEAQVEIVERHVADALEKGARVLTGGRRVEGEGHWFEPTVLVDVNHEMLCMQEETFGPTLPIMAVEDAAEAVRLANESSYGLSASIWAGDRERARELALELDCGAVTINDVATNLMDFSAPMAGWKSSGIGSRLGAEAGVRKFCRPIAISDTRLVGGSEPNWYPYRSHKSQMVERLNRLVNGRGLGRLRGKRRTGG